ncbi:hypothetical protein QE152_g30205 [Popillia japonica]|uniref:Uncharacterized protein n=1 Tax=Popillia japonica TaxID=7064 RepID=A0AAW1JFL9_POPJA
MQSSLLVFDSSSMYRKKILTENGIEQFWANFTGLSYDDDTGFSNADSDEDRILPESDNEVEVEDVGRSASGNSVQEESEDEEDNLPLSSFVPLKRSKVTVKKDILWKSKFLIWNDDQLRFHGDIEVSEEILALEQQFFNSFFNKNCRRIQFICCSDQN